MKIRNSINNEDNPQRSLSDIQAIIVHHTGSLAPDINMRKYLNRKDYISCQYMVAKDGTIWHLMDDDRIAYHCGVSKWEGLTSKGNSLNWCTVGIEVNSNGKTFTEAQMKATKELIEDLMAQYDIPANFVLRHKDVAPNRKWDIGEAFHHPLSWKQYQSMLNKGKYSEIAIKQIEAIINCNSVLWNLVQDKELRSALEKNNRYLRSVL